MAKVKLTDLWVRSATASDGKRREVGDLLCPGLYLRIGIKGRKTFSLVMRSGNGVQRQTLGRYPVLTLAEAREKALQTMRATAGLVPAGPASFGAEPAGAGSSETLGDLIDSYETHIRQNARSWQMIMTSLRRREMQHLYPRPARLISRRDLMAVVDGIAAAGTPHAGTNLLRHLKMALNWSVERGRLDTSPLDKARAPVRSTERDRVLSDAELAAVWRGCDALADPWRSLIRVLILTGQRRSEVSGMRWEEVDLATATWTIPRERVKKDRSHAVPLAPAAVAILRELSRGGTSGFVFSTDGGRRASSNFHKTKAKLDTACGVVGWTLHDLRRSCRSGLAAPGVPREVARAVVNHADGKIDRVYNRYDYASEKREALERWAESLRIVLESRS